MLFSQEWRSVGARCPGLAFVLIVPIALPVTVFAQDAQPEPTASIEEGRFIYSRGVPYGSAIGPRTPYREHSVVTGPTNIILSAMANGLTPLGDDENAGVVAGTNSPAEMIEGHLMLSLGGGIDGTASTPLASDNGNIQGSATGAALGHLGGTIQNAMGTLRSVLGGGE